MTESGFTFRQKTIALLSPQSWDHIGISKHHYARALAAMGNTVYYVDPPHKKGRINRVDKIQENLFRLQYSLPFPYFLRFKAVWLFNFLMRFQARKVQKLIGQKIDILWSFDPNVYANLRTFKADLYIFHPVDPLHYTQHLKAGASADIVFTVSDKIKEEMASFQYKTHVVDHALSEAFSSNSWALLQGEINREKSEQVKVGYVGNLMRSAVDRESLLEMVRSASNVEFHLWGPLVADENSMDEKTFVKELSGCSNVVLRGVMPSDDLPGHMNEMDAFVLAYKFVQGISDLSNSHKLMEYLSTGKVVVSTLFERYANKRELLEMPKDAKNDELVSLLGKVLDNLETFNSEELQKKRILFALENTIDRKIGEMETLIAKR